MVTFILVHGTFVKSADWPALQRGLVEVTNSGQDACIENIPWTGSNRATARQTAAEDISNKVRARRSNNPDEKIFLIGHSHGGSAIAYFLKIHLEEAAKVEGCAFLSTPFVAIRRRNDASRILGALTFFRF
jgi:alpha-beta hydrolase superfamily lysophospholipase